jgi:hypothetical protein
MNSLTKSIEQPLLAEGGVNIPVLPGDDPYIALDDLMKVVEALFPIWPERPPFNEGSQWKL